MNAEQLIKAEILRRAVANETIDPVGELTAENVDALYDANNEDYELQDEAAAMREGYEETDIKADWSRNYESKSVAAKLGPDGQWVGWTYWYGGGKHGEPESIDWMDSAYFLDVVEEEKVVTVRTFTVREEDATA